ncbi:MAG TPA: hypothetical protein VGL71_08360 [Urbifossiella sp.]|jgi:hypothetical protein
MVISRWKVMAGVIGVSIGGLAAITAQSPKEPPLPMPLHQAEEKPAAKVEAKLPPMNNDPVKPPAPKLPMPDPLLPAVPVVPASASTPAAPSKPNVELPTLPLPDVKPTEPKLPTPKPMETSAKTPPPKAAPVVVVPNGLTLPPSDKSEVPPPSAPTAPMVPPALEPITASATPSSVFSGLQPSQPEPSNVPSRTPPPAGLISPTEPLIPPTNDVPTAKPPIAAQAAPTTKFRIVLRVGEGEPSFEVRHGDDLIMKVACDKVDIKSPVKGQGLSNITATGKVRFVGFGAEGTCDSLSFLAGSGEVALAGNVNVKVRDKIGRVESELNADKMQYKLDQTALSGVLKP